MGSIRVTQRILVDRVLNNISAANLRLLKLQDQLATGQRVNTPSDDPLAARRAINARSEIAKNDQYLTNISTISPQLLETETAIRTSVDIVQRVRELTLQGANDTNGQEQRDAIAIEINQLLENLLVQSNTITNGRYIFGGTRTLNEPFAATRDSNGDITAVSFEGNAEQINIEISEGTTVVSNVPGDSVFNSTSASTEDIFQVLIDVRDNLFAGDTAALQDRLGELETAEDQLLVSTARIGAITSRIERVDSNLQEINVQLADVLSDNIDADFAEVTLNLNAQSNAFQAALTAGARVIQPSLLQFLQ